MSPGRDIPSYFVYGEPSRPIDIGFFHVEAVRERNSVHMGTVEPHQHADMAQVTFWTSGEGVYQIDENDWHFSAPAVSFVASRTVHGFRVADHSDAIVLSMADAQLAALRSGTDLRLDHSVFATGKGGEWPLLERVMTLLLTQYRLGAPAATALMSSLSLTALNYIARLSGEALSPSAPAQERAIYAFRNLMEEQSSSSWTLQDYASAIGTSPHRLDLAAKSILGKSVKQAILDRRLLEAKRLLRFTIRTIEDIGYSLGFEDPSYFSRFFRRMTGLSPSAWRAKETGQG